MSNNRFSTGTIAVFVVAAVLAVAGITIFYTHPDEQNPSSTTAWTCFLFAALAVLVIGAILRNSGRRSQSLTKSRIGLALASIGTLGTALMVAFMGLLVFFHDEDTSGFDFSLQKDEQKQRQTAQTIVDGLNTRDSAKVALLRDQGGYVSPEEHAADVAQEQSIQAVLPPTGCHYTLTDVQDKGEQGKKIVPGLVRPLLIFQLDAVVDLNCPSQPATSKTIGILFIQSYGHWTPLSFVTP